MEVLSQAVGPEAANPHPEDTIGTMEAGMRVGAQRHLELMAKDQVLEREIAACSDGNDERTKHKDEKFGHPPG